MHALALCPYSQDFLVALVGTDTFNKYVNFGYCVHCGNRVDAHPLIPIKITKKQNVCCSSFFFKKKK